VAQKVKDDQLRKVQEQCTNDAKMNMKFVLELRQLTEEDVTDMFVVK
jgi:hypothetical protein